MYPSYVRHEQKGNSLYCLYNSSVNLKSLQNNKALHILDNYFGDTQEDKICDFCDRYWNLIHGWKKYNDINIIEDYD